MLTQEEIKALIPIDPNQLGECCSEQPSLFMEASDLSSEMKAQVEEAEYKVERLKATISLKYRSGELESKAGKTEATINALVSQHPEVQKLENDLIQLKKESSKCSSLVIALDHRRSMLTNHVTLHSTGYYQCSDIKPRQHVDRESTEKAIVGRRGVQNG
jgi:hypothetical protein